MGMTGLEIETTIREEKQWGRITFKQTMIGAIVSEPPLLSYLRVRWK